VVTAHYDTAGELEKYIDLIPMLRNLFIEPEVFFITYKRGEIKKGLI